MSATTGVMIGTAVAVNGGGGQIGPSLWFMVMMIATFPLIAWLYSDSCMRSRHGFRAGFTIYGVFGIASMLVIMALVPGEAGQAKPENPAIAAECQQVIDRYNASEVRTQELVHAYLDCEPDAGAGWLIWLFLGFVAVVSVLAVIMESRQPDPKIAVAAELQRKMAEDWMRIAAGMSEDPKGSKP